MSPIERMTVHMTPNVGTASLRFLPVGVVDDAVADALSLEDEAPPLDGEAAIDTIAADRTKLQDDTSVYVRVSTAQQWMDVVACQAIRIRVL